MSLTRTGPSDLYRLYLGKTVSARHNIVSGYIWYLIGYQISYIYIYYWIGNDYSLGRELRLKGKLYLLSDRLACLGIMGD